MRTVVLLLLALTCAAAPAGAQRKNPPTAPSTPPGGEVGAQTLPPKVCPSDNTDALQSGERTYYGISAHRIVQSWLSHDSYGRVQSGTQNVSVSSQRILMDGTDRDACLRLTTIMTNGARSAPAPSTYVYFTAGGFYFVSQWTRAQTLDNYTTGYVRVMVFDTAFNLRGVYAF